mmetsp:Transcript_10629/g.29447  ORF Transcript_10629/g.29447 Transcript_10629/m.29447 type:complete len:225 (-) Transcript_10629:481-1155(-)
MTSPSLSLMVTNPMILPLPSFSGSPGGLVLSSLVTSMSTGVVLVLATWRKRRLHPLLVLCASLCPIGCHKALNCDGQWRPSTFLPCGCEGRTTSACSKSNSTYGSSLHLSISGVMTVCRERLPAATAVPFLVPSAKLIMNGSPEVVLSLSTEGSSSSLDSSALAGGSLVLVGVLLVRAVRPSPGRVKLYWLKQVPVCSCESLPSFPARQTLPTKLHSRRGPPYT